MKVLCTCTHELSIFSQTSSEATDPALIDSDESVDEVQSQATQSKNKTVKCKLPSNDGDGPEK